MLFRSQIKAAEKRMAEIAVLRTHIVNYAKTREVYVASVSYTHLDVYKRQASCTGKRCASAGAGTGLYGI